MTDREVSLGLVVAAGLWSLAAGLLVVAWIVGLPMLGVTAVAATVVAMTATVRCYFVTHHRLIRAAFELGRDSAAGVRQMR